MSGSLVADLGISPEIWVYLALLGCLTLFFKFSRVWSVRNLDLLLLFAVSPGLMMLVGAHDKQPYVAFVLLFLGSALWLVRCLVDLGLARRPLLEPNLNAAGLSCLVIGVLGLLLTEAVTLPVDEGLERNPAGAAREDAAPPGSLGASDAVDKVLKTAPLPGPLKHKLPEVVISRLLACVSHIIIVLGLIAVGWWHFERPITGLAMAACYLMLPYTRIALVDGGQVLPAALIVGAVVFYDRPSVAGPLIGLAAGWMPACLGLIALWTGFNRGRGAWRFLLTGLAVAGTCGLLALTFPALAAWARAVGARSLAEIGMFPGVEAPATGSFWSGLDVYWRLPVLVVYLALVGVTSLWPADKNLGELIALSAALLVASQFWYVDEGGTLVLLYLPMVILMMFRPTLMTKRAFRRERPGRAVLTMSSGR